MLLYDLYTRLNKKGCNVSISEIKDALDLLQNVDINDTDLVYQILHTTLAKNDVCEAALDETLDELRKSMATSVTQTPTEPTRIAEEPKQEKVGQGRNNPVEVDFGEWW